MEARRFDRLPRYEETLSAVLIGAKEAVLAPMRPTLRAHDITEPQWRVMRVLNDRGATDASGLASVGLLHAPSVTRILKELEARRLVSRATDHADRRRTVATLTPEGRALVDTVAREVIRIMALYYDRFGPERLDRLQSELRALSAAIADVE